MTARLVRPRRTDVRAPSVEVMPRHRWSRLAAAYLALGAGAWIYAPVADADAWWAHGVWCLAGLVVAAPTLLSIFRYGFGLILTDHRLMFLAAFSVFFLFGGALLAVGPQGQALQVLSHYPIGAQDALRIDAINGIGFGLALLTAARARGHWLGGQAASVASRLRRVPKSWVIGTFLVIGLAASVSRAPHDLGLAESPPSGIVRMLSQMALVAVFMLAASQGRYEQAQRLAAVILALGLALIGTLTFMKAATLMPLVALTAGLALRFGPRKVFPVAALVLVTIFLALGNLTNYGRGLQSAAQRTLTVSERWSSLAEGWAVSANLVDDEQYAWWARLCNVPTEVAALDLRDAGRGGEGLRLMWWVFIPRFLAPQKPIMTFGDELYTKITGYAGSSDALGVFASGYYHGGWWGFVFASVICGWIVAQTTAVARAIQASQAPLMLPLLLMGMNIAFSISDDFVSTYLGAFVFILYPLLAASAFMPVARRRPSASVSQPLPLSR